MPLLGYSLVTSARYLGIWALPGGTHFFADISSSPTAADRANILFPGATDSTYPYNQIIDLPDLAFTAGAGALPLGAAVDVTAVFKALTRQELTEIAAGMKHNPGQIAFIWTGPPEFSTGPLYVRSVNDIRGLGISYDDLIPALGGTFLPLTTTTPLEVGDTLSDPDFSLNSTRPLYKVTLNDGTGVYVTLTASDSTSILINPITSYAPPSRSYSYTVPTQVIFTTTMYGQRSPGVNGRQLTYTYDWFYRIYYGTAIHPGSLDDIFIQTLPSSLLALIWPSDPIFFEAPITTDSRHFIAAPSSFGVPSLTRDLGTDLPVDLDKVAGPVAVTNDFGVTANYDIYATTFIESARFLLIKAVS